MQSMEMVFVLEVVCEANEIIFREVFFFLRWKEIFTMFELPARPTSKRIHKRLEYFDF